MKKKSSLGLASLVVTTALGAPTITVEPVDQSMAVGARVVVRVVATTTSPPLTYQWRFNEADLPDMTASTLTVAQARFSDSGRYDVRIGDGSGSVVSRSVQLTVVPEDVVRLGEGELRFGTPVELPWETPETQGAWPFITSDGLTLVFASDRPGGMGLRDLWMVTRPDLGARWGKPTNLGAPVNTAAIEDDPWLSADGRSLYFDSTRPGGHGNRDLWVATRTAKDAPFGVAENLGPAINSASYEATGCVSRDHLTLLFCSERTGGDIWISTRDRTSAGWTTARNLGAPVNRSSYEATPFLSADGLTLYFMSDRHRPGTGSLWVTSRATSDSPFHEPALIHSYSRILSRGADFPMLSVDEKTLYFNSYPDGFPGRTQLWRSEITKLPRLQSLGLDESGGFQFELRGREGVTYTIEESSDLQIWNQRWSTNTSDRMLLRDSPAASGPRYFRATHR
ncbi:MAG: PD40 domain-containing protein [Verrucomicrobiales bacterium]|nr:PD40 domain-containing protein [Verrucomicrobiales bacterium]